MTTASDQSRTTKEQMLHAIQSLPDDASFEDGMERLLFLARFELALEEEARGEYLTQEEMEAHFEEWLQ